MYNLFLDDIRLPQDCVTYMHTRIGVRNPIYINERWVIARDYKEFVEIIKTNGLPKFVSFDHDLAFDHYDIKESTDCLSWEEYYQMRDRDETGYDCVCWLTEYCIKNNLQFPEYAIHSMNPDGIRNIQFEIDRFNNLVK